MSHAFLLRHGSTATSGRFCGSTDSELTEAGWHQMWAAVEGRLWHRIVSSPALRCREFGEALAQRLTIPHGEDSRLREMHFGDWEGASPAEIMIKAPEALKRFWEDPVRHPPPGAESPDAVRRRVLSAWNEWVLDEPRGRVLLVTHAGPMRFLRDALDPSCHVGVLGIDVPHAALWDTCNWRQPDAPRCARY